jgi:inner membrane protein
MSSFIGHSLASLTTYAITQQLQIDRPNKISQIDWRWLIWLLVVASIPDIDYLIPGLRVQQAERILRITHSLLGVLPIPGFTIVGLWLLGKRGKSFKLQSLQVVLVGLSHLLLDLLTGVFPLPLLYPFGTQTFRLPFGLLPSAGRIQLSNYFFYRNLSIELGVLVPLSMSLLLSVRQSTRSGKGLSIIVAGLMVSICFMIWASTLDR